MADGRASRGGHGEGIGRTGVKIERASVDGGIAAGVVGGAIEIHHAAIGLDEADATGNAQPGVHIQCGTREDVEVRGDVRAGERPDREGRGTVLDEDRRSVGQRQRKQTAA